MSEPVAWAVAGDYGDYAVALVSDKASAQTEADRRALVGLRPDYVVVPLYRAPTLTDSEREALVEMALVCDSRERKSVEFKLPEEAAHWRGMAETLRGLLAARSETANV